MAHRSIAFFAIFAFMPDRTLRFSVIIALLLLISCTEPNPADVIQGSWAVNEARTSMPGLDPRILKEADFKEMNTTYRFGPKGKFEISGPDIIGSYQGYWEFNPGDTSIALIYFSETDTLSYDLKLISWTRNSMKLRQSYFEAGTTELSMERLP